MLLRLVVPGDDAQQEKAVETPRAAESVAISVHVLCERAWLMEQTYAARHPDIAAAIRLSMNLSNVVLKRSAVEAGLDCWARVVILPMGPSRTTAHASVAKPSCPSTRRP